MGHARCRRFTILDGMILIAGVAVGAALAKIGPQEWAMSPWWRFRLFMLVDGPASMFLVGPTVAFLAIRLRTPRPKLARMARQPGAAAALAVVATLVILAASWTLYGWLHRQGWFTTKEYIARFWRMSHDPIGVAVACAWLALAISGRWRHERGWIDRLGIGLGLFWIATIAFEWQLARWSLTLWDLVFGRYRP